MPAKQKKLSNGQLSIQKNEVSIKDRIIDAALQLTEQQDWNFLSIRNIAEEAELSLAEFYDFFGSKEEIIAAYGARLDRKVLENFNDPDFESSTRDRLFDLLMERFDLANQNRKALISIMRSFYYDPKTAFFSFSQLGNSMAKMLEASGVDTNGPRGAARVYGLTIACGWVMRTWIHDETADLTQTMAELDKALNRCESIANTVNL